MNVRIVNKTGLVRDTEVWVEDTRLAGITAVHIHEIKDRMQIVKATLEVYIKELDVVAEVQE